ncbi:hypothetical protein H0H93_000936 [Arthromyces matolae]|nr:hypothetical protein H0H93_000936 [Arthromyces matolae]
MEHVGQGLKDASWDSVSPEIRQRAHDLHLLLRNVGIEHGDFFPRNVCVKKDGQVRIIDFSHSTMKL